MYGSMAFTVHNLERLRTRTIAAVCCDTPAEDYDLTTTAFSVTMSFNACPSFTDAVWPEIAGRHYSRSNPGKLWRTQPFRSGIDNFFGEPMIGVPLNAVSMNNGGHLHHNSMDTIDKVDPRTLSDLSILNAVYLYYMADAGFDDVPLIADLTFDRAVNVVLEKKSDCKARISEAQDGAAFGKLLADGTKTIKYYTDLEKKAIAGIERIVSEDMRSQARDYLSEYTKNLDEFGTLMVQQFQRELQEKARAESISITKYVMTEGPWEKEAAGIIPKRMKVGTLTLDGIPVEALKSASYSPRWWSARNWAAASYFWCDGKRNLNEIKELIELEADVPVRNFDLVAYFKFLEQYGMVEFVKK